MTVYLGDYNPGDTIDLKFTTVAADGAPSGISSGSAAVYKGNSTTETSTGVTLTTNFDSRTGLNHIRIVTSDSFYTADENYQVVLTGGTVDGKSVSGYVVAQFSLQKRNYLRPTTAGRTLNVDANSRAESDVRTWLGSTPNVLSSGRVDAIANALGSGVITASSIAADAITSAKIADGALTAAKFASGALEAVWDKTIEGSRTALGSIRIILSALAGKVLDADTATIKFRDTTDTKDRIVASVDGKGNRTAVTLDDT